MKKVLIAGPGADDYHIMEYTVAAVEKSNMMAFPSLDATAVAYCDGVVIPGGVPDVCPDNYGEEVDGAAHPNPELDRQQLDIIDAAVKAGKPIMGICRGHQILSVYFGATLIQDLREGKVHNTVPDVETLHETICLSDSKLAELYGLSPTVNTKHHQALKKIPKHFKATQFWFSSQVSESEKATFLKRASEQSELEGTDDCMIEAIEHESLPIFSIQWHPEYMIAHPSEGAVDGQKIFDYFAELLNR